MRYLIPLIVLIFFAGCGKTDVERIDAQIEQLQSEKDSLFSEINDLNLKTKEDYVKNDVAKELCKNVAIVEEHIKTLEGRLTRIKKEQNIQEQNTRREKYRSPDLPDMEDIDVSEKSGAVIDRILLQKKYEAERRQEERKINEAKKIRESQKKAAIEKLCPSILVLKQNIDATGDFLESDSTNLPEKEELIKRQKNIANKWHRLYIDIEDLAYELENAVNKNQEAIVQILQSQWEEKTGDLHQLIQEQNRLINKTQEPPTNNKTRNIMIAMVVIILLLIMLFHKGKK
jgi:hypothetical protein